MLNSLHGNPRRAPNKRDVANFRRFPNLGPAQPALPGLIREQERESATVAEMRSDALSSQPDGQTEGWFCDHTQAVWIKLSDQPATDYDQLRFVLLHLPLLTANPIAHGIVHIANCQKAEVGWYISLHRSFIFCLGK